MVSHQQQAGAIISFVTRVVYTLHVVISTPYKYVCLLFACKLYARLMGGRGEYGGFRSGVQQGRRPE
jgi:hypothetical protein